MFKTLVIPAILLTSFHAHAGSQCDTAVKNARVALQAGKYQQADTHFQEVSRYCSKYPPVMQFFWAKSLFQLERYDDAERKLKGFLKKESSGKRATQARKLLGQISEIRKAQAKLKKAGMGSARLQDTARLRARKPGTFGFGVGLPEYNATEGFATGLKLPPHPKDTGAIPPALTGLSASDPFGVTPEFLQALSDAQKNESSKSVEVRLAGWEKVVNLGGSQDAAVAGRAKAHITALKTYLAKVAKWEQLSVDRDKEIERRAVELDERFQSDSAQLKKYLGLEASAFSTYQKAKLQAEFDGVYGWYFAEKERRDELRFQNLGTRAYNAGDYEGAVSAFRLCLERAPTHANCLLGLGVAYEKLRNFAKAKENFVKLLQYAPDHKHVELVRRKLERIEAR